MDVLAIAKEMDVPIIEQDGLECINSLIQELNAKEMLEIGTAIGYSTSQFALANDSLNITSVERNKEWFNVAEKVIAHYGLKTRVALYLEDALEFETTKKYDVIFIDAAKAQYQRFFERFEEALLPGGVIICDNLNFHGLTKEPDKIESRNLRALVKKINRFVEWLENHPNYETQFLDVADGLSVSRKKS